MYVLKLVILEHHHIYYPLEHFVPKFIMLFYYNLNIMPQSPSWKTPLSYKVKIPEFLGLRTNYTINRLISFVHSSVYPVSTYLLYTYNVPSTGIQVLTRFPINLEFIVYR